MAQNDSPMSNPPPITPSGTCQFPGRHNAAAAAIRPQTIAVSRATRVSDFTGE